VQIRFTALKSNQVMCSLLEVPTTQRSKQDGTQDYRKEKMISIKESPIKWRVQRMMCSCGGEFEHKFNVSYADLPHTHVCNKCFAIENAGSIYPKTVWDEA
jgi:hypothetical protein